jgi:hypothetical protein
MQPPHAPLLLAAAAGCCQPVSPSSSPGSVSISHIVEVLMPWAWEEERGRRDAAAPLQPSDDLAAFFVSARRRTSGNIQYVAIAAIYPPRLSSHKRVTQNNGVICFHPVSFPSPLYACDHLSFCVSTPCSSPHQPSAPSSPTHTHQHTTPGEQQLSQPHTACCQLCSATRQQGS